MVYAKVWKLILVDMVEHLCAHCAAAFSLCQVQCMQAALCLHSSLHASQLVTPPVSSSSFLL